MALQILRVIAGTAKGRKLNTLPGRAVRPSSDRLKEALFSSLGDLVDGASVLDLYAGSGALGIEALSRGAKRAVFVEKDRRAAEIIAGNLASTGLSSRARIVRATVEQYLAGPVDAVADLVLIDPPYDVGLPSRVLELLAEGGFIAEESLLVVEGSARKDLSGAPGGFSVRSERRYGDSVLVTLGWTGASR